ncbi:monomeric sarcosine oxidase [Procambarus clarkii]|uniref:monomeric sarcosine oxidase n=1 Tax=Procambarus clarkii TaxID=6728 RepID=UPI001E67077A|nr:uncharacterized protein LOC123769512 [Procambarus clarkii]XP_045616636.1 uncharacterized protein LOC123769512 [Procambarus clarkii]XP_045616637.1 uncharacterized protein LOC123769512 [Procambarus clarkii]
MSAPEENVYQLIVVGAGMIGSAAAYHASLIPNTSVCLVGPAEPKCRKGREIFGCWYDEGRLCYRVSGTPTWSTLASESLYRYRELEKLTGINFFIESGHVYATSEKGRWENRLKLSKKYAPDIEDITKTWMNIFTFFNLPEDVYITYEKSIAGHLSPRNLVQAHQTAAQMHGAQIVRKIVSTVVPSKSDAYKWDVMTECGTVLRGHRVLVAVGAYAALKPLFQHVCPNLVPQLALMAQTVAYLHVGEEEAQRLKLMPSLNIESSFGKLDGAYILPPIKYPDGKWYLKLGHGDAYEQRKTTLDEVKDWYIQQSGSPECMNELAKYLCHILPGLKVEKVTADGCLTSDTPTREPYIEVVAEGFGLALGGNGCGAKSCDEIGRLAAHLVILGEWESEIPKERLKTIWEPSQL